MRPKMAKEITKNPCWGADFPHFETAENRFSPKTSHSFRLSLSFQEVNIKIILFLISILEVILPGNKNIDTGRRELTILWDLANHQQFEGRFFKTGGWILFEAAF
ncbi:hypothetical protein AAC387_Pa01g0884 [Persea americana]